MTEYSHDIKSIQTTSIKQFEKDLGYYMRLGYFIQGGIFTQTVIKKYFPLRIETQYTAIVQKTIKIEEHEDGDQG